MKKCLNCEAENHPAAEACWQCAAPLAAAEMGSVYCPQCGAANSTDWFFCQQCGHSLPRLQKPEPEPPPVRQETVEIGSYQASAPPGIETLPEAPSLAQVQPPEVDSEPSIPTVPPMPIPVIEPRHQNRILDPFPSPPIPVKEPPAEAPVEEPVARVSCSACGLESTGGAFCSSCGAPLTARLRPPVEKPAPAPSEPPRLELIADLSRVAHSFPVEKDEVVIGRLEGDLTFPQDGFVSTRHARLLARDGRYFLRDEDSRNGTFLRLKGEVELQDGDIFLVGRQLFRFVKPPRADH